MKNIKMRIYDKSCERMIYSVECDDGLQGKREWVPFCFPIGFSYDTEWFSEIMMSSGLPDKTGKEIFEGDIIRADGMRDPIAEIVFTQGMFNANKWDSWDCGLRNNKCEVIGNIYENPELLEQGDV